MADLGSYVVANLVFVLTIPVAIFCHELGHAIPVVVTGGKAHIIVGTTEGRTVDVGPIRLTVGSNEIWHPWFYGRCISDGNQSRPVRAISILGGPGVSFLLVVAAGIANSAVEHDVFSLVMVGLFYYGLFSVFITLLPIEYPSWWGQYAGNTSDGYKFLELVRG